MKDNSQSCHNCYYSEYGSITNHGYNLFCKRYPPHLPREISLAHQTNQFPRVSCDDWCGEFRPKE